MLTMVESSTTMSCATPRRASTAQRLGSGAGEGAAGMHPSLQTRLGRSEQARATTTTADAGGTFRTGS